MFKVLYEIIKMLHKRMLNAIYLYRISLRKKCPYSDLFWSVFSRIWTEYGEIWSISPYSVRLRENKDQHNSQYGYFLRSVHKNTSDKNNSLNGYSNKP